MVNLSSTRVPRIHNGERIVYSANGIGNTECPYENEIGFLHYTIHKINSKLIEDLKLKPETVKLLEENIGEKLKDIVRGMTI